MLVHLSWMEFAYSSPYFSRCATICLSSETGVADTITLQHRPLGVGLTLEPEELHASCQVSLSSSPLQAQMRMDGLSPGLDKRAKGKRSILFCMLTRAWGGTGGDSILLH